MENINWENTYSIKNRLLIYFLTTGIIYIIFIIIFLFLQIIQGNTILVVIITLLSALIGGTIGLYIWITRYTPNRVGLSKNKLHLRFKNNFYDIDIEKKNIDKIGSPNLPLIRHIKIHLKTGPKIKIVGSKELITNINKISN